MRKELLMPKLGLTMTEGQLAEWPVKPGDVFKAGDILFVIETEKTTMDIEATEAGVMLELAVAVGETVPVSTVIAYWDDDASVEPAPLGAAAPTPPAAGPASRPATQTALAPMAAAEPGTARGADHGAAGGTNRRFATPLARRLAQQFELDLGCIAGSGPRGRIKAIDVKTAAQAGIGKSAQPDAPPRDAAARAPGAGDLGIRSRTRPSATRATLARRLTKVKQEVPHFYAASEAEVSALLALQAELNGLDPGLRLTLTHFLVAAIGRALHDHPEANRVWTDDDIVEFARADVGVAVNTGHGLFAPLVRDAGRLTLTEVARLCQAQVAKARAGALTVNDMVGGAVSVSNAGMFNVTHLTPIITPGQAMILGVGKVRDVLALDGDGALLTRKEMGLVLAVDHRVHDGVGGIQFLNAVIGYLQQPMRLLLAAPTDDARRAA